MIDKEELILISKKLKLDPSIIEKDYVLGWMLNGIYNTPEVQNSWVFKGGTSLKKCYFNEYRFSEDLDFSLIEMNEDPSAWRSIIVKIAEWVNDQSGIEIPNKFIEVDIYSSSQGQSMIEASIRFNGPLHRKTNLPRIKLDLSPYEKIVLKPVKRPIYHPYSDSLKENTTANCYPFEEVFAEKIRALAERARPRDLYDVVHLYRSRDRIKSKTQLLEILAEKCSHKNIPIPKLDEIRAHPKNVIATEWKNMLNHQLPELDSYENYYNELPSILDWLYSKSESRP
ncbi:MAG: nucleotidyl transferase AbiEii/AbiGii toxin family protein [Verrucomicrobia bacterium]|nr:nucleotidyl transferase AbiEii/AbiGii toxin family protein [Verrucomicrobiota bacterium]